MLEASIEGAHGVLINIAGPSDLGLLEAEAASELVRQAIHPEAQIIWGLALNDAYGDEVRVIVIAAGFDTKTSVEPAERAETAAPVFPAQTATRQAVSQPQQRPASPAIAVTSPTPGQGSPLLSGMPSYQPQPTQPAAPSVPVQQPVQQAQPVQPVQPMAQPLPTYAPSVPSFDATSEHSVISANDPGDLDIPDFLR